MALDPQGDEIVVATESGPLQAWNLETGQLVGMYPPEAAGELIAFSPDGAWLATIRSEEQSVRLFDPGARELRLILLPPDDLLGTRLARRPGDTRCYAKAVAFNSDGSLLATQGCAGVRVFGLGIDQLLAIAHANVTRSFTADECRQYLHGDCPPA